MAVETTKDSLCINQIIEQKNESVVVEGDSIIPDIKPDILSAVSTVGTVCIYKKEILEGKHDNLPESAFINAGNIDTVVARAKESR